MSLSTATHLHQAVMCGPYYMYLSGRKFSWSFSESYCEALAPWRRVIYLAGEETLPLWKHSSNRWRQPISPTFSLRCHPGMQDFLFYLPLINFTSQIKYCLATIGEYHKSYQSMENKISEFFAILSKAGRDTWEEVIKYLQVVEEQTWREVIKRSHCATFSLDKKDRKRKRKTLKNTFLGEMVVSWIEGSWLVLHYVLVMTKSLATSRLFSRLSCEIFS